MTSIVDANVLLNAANTAAVHHRPCLAWLTDAMNGSDPVGFTWIVLAAFVRLVTKPAVMPSPLSVGQAFDCVEAWLSQPPSRLIDPGIHHLATLRRLLEAAGAGGDLTSDAHLAAIAIEHGAELVSCDSDFARFPGVRWFNPLTGGRLKP